MKTSTLAISLSLSLSLSAAGCNVQFVPEADAAADAAPVVDNGTTPPADAGVTPPADSGSTPPPPVDAGPQCQTGRTACGTSCCELATDRNNCGACGNVCAGAATCVAGTCVSPTPPPADAGTTPPPSCYAPYAPCGGACVNLQTNVANCGYCGRACATGQTCAAGSCVSPTPPPPVCNPSTCPTPPHSNPSCVGNACSFTCFASYGNCDGNVGNGCETGLTTNANCGACGHVCATGSNCQSGMCVTAPPPPARYLRARIPAGYACTWDLDVDPASAMFCAPTSGGEFYVDVSGVYWPGNHIRIGVATSDPRTTPASRLTWVVNDIANLGRTARSLGFTVLQFEQGGVVTDLLDSAQACVDVCHPAYPGWRETKVTVRTRSDASVCPITCDAR